MASFFLLKISGGGAKAVLAKHLKGYEHLRAKWKWKIVSHKGLEGFQEKGR